MMGVCTRRRVYVLFLSITIIQIVSTGARQIFDFMGPLWAMILTNFLNIVFAIFGFFGGYTKRVHYLISYVVWSIGWSAWNGLIVCLYLPVPSLETYKSSILSLGTGGFSWWETRAPGCTPDWASETQLIVTNCSFDPRVVECLQAGLQVYLAIVGIVTAISVLLCPYNRDDEKDSSSKNGDSASKAGSFYTLSRNGSVGSTRTRQRAALGIPGGGSGSGQTGDNIAGVSANGTVDDRLRPMTPRKVKRRSARSIQSQKFGPQTTAADAGRNTAGPSGSGNSARNSLRSNSSSRRSQARNSKRKMNHFVSPVNRLMQQVDSETSHDDPRTIHRYPVSSKFPMRDQGHVNPVYLGPQSPRNPPPPPRPPSARSSYSNYHPARLPPMAVATSPPISSNVLNLNQNIFTNPAFDTSTEYNNSQLSGQTNNAFYEEEISFLPPPGPNHMPPPPTNPMVVSRTNHFHFSQTNLLKTEVSTGNLTETANAVFAYPLAHSPVSQESFPMWGVAQAQVPTNRSNNQQQQQQQQQQHQQQQQQHYKPYHPIHSIRTQTRPNGHQPVNSETVI